jgi:hypothetical protein
MDPSLRHEAIPYLQGGFANPICIVWDCFVPRNDGGIKKCTACRLLVLWDVDPTGWRMA